MSADPQAGAHRDSLAAYYAERAGEYEAVYAKPERQVDLAILHEIVAEYFRRRQVLELACGTGYWTALLARAAASVMATDIGADVLQVARGKRLPEHVVRFAVADAYAPESIVGDFDACFAGFWWSHIPLGQLDVFLRALHRRLACVTRVMFLDNTYVEGSNHPVARRDEDGNSYQVRRLANGTVHDVLKNFPSPAEVEQRLHDAGAVKLTVSRLPYYWWVAYDVG